MITHLSGFIVALLVTTQVAFATDNQSGVEFRSHETTKDYRTGLILTPDRPIECTNSLKIQFDLRFWDTSEVFGHIFRMIGEEGVNIDLVSSQNMGLPNSLLLIIGDSASGISFTWDEIELRKEWNSCSLIIDNTTNSVSLAINGISKSSFFRANQQQYQIAFGKSDVPGLRTLDVPPIAVKDIKVEADNRLIRHWPMAKHRDGYCYDSLDNFPMKVINGEWIIDRSTSWTILDSIATDNRPQITFDKSGKLYLLSSDELVEYNLSSRSQIRSSLKDSAALPSSQQSLYVSESNEICTFDLKNQLVNKFNLATLIWTQRPSDFLLEPEYWHVNKLINDQGEAYFFGGYGFHTYKNQLFNYSSSGEWQKNQLTAIEPRSLGAAGLNSQGDLILFGGFGSKSGRQEQNPREFYQCNVVQPEGPQVTQLWDLGNPGTDYVYSNSLVVTPDDASFFVLSYHKDQYNGFAYLEQYNLETGEKVVYDDSLSFKFHGSHSYADLFLDTLNNQLIAVLSEATPNGYTTRLYSINNPPLRKSEVLQPLVAETKFWQLLAIIALTLGVALLIVITRKRWLTRTINQKVTVEPERNAVYPLSSNDKAENKRKSVILLMNGFQVIDKEGNDITNKFATTLKLLFCLILLHSLGGRNGATSQIIWDEVWGDKPEKKAKNNRNVNINKLRVLLKQVGNIEVLIEGDRWRIELGDDVFCDYAYLMEVLNKKGKKIPVSILSVIGKGNFLPKIEAEWLDHFKSDLSNRLIDVLLTLNHQENLSNELKIQLADTIFNFDIINQAALVIKCNALNASGKFALARNCYESFIKEYKHMYDEPFEVPFDKIIYGSSMEFIADG